MFNIHQLTCALTFCCNAVVVRDISVGAWRQGSWCVSPIHLNYSSTKEHAKSIVTHERICVAVTVLKQKSKTCQFACAFAKTFF
uniref:Putative secreted protein n=1 Tax=Ixodes ricinus TaxID=34613 RepID=A0A6B0TXK5_IXORI